MQCCYVCVLPQGWVANVQDAHVPPTHQAPPAPIGKPPGPPIGSLMQSLGHQLVGKLVMRFWPDDGDHWWAAHVEDWTAGKGHKLVYEKGTEDESYEWAKLGEFGPDELQPHGSHPLPPLLPVGAHRGPPAPALPLVLPPAVAAMLVGMNFFCMLCLLEGKRSTDAEMLKRQVLLWELLITSAGACVIFKVCRRQHFDGAAAVANCHIMRLAARSFPMHATCLLCISHIATAAKAEPVSRLQLPTAPQ